MAKQNYYVVLVGRTPGIYTNWEDCKSQVNGYKGAKYKGFKSIQEAQQYIADNEQSSKDKYWTYFNYNRVHFKTVP